MQVVLYNGIKHFLKLVINFSNWQTDFVLFFVHSCDAVYLS